MGERWTKVFEKYGSLALNEALEYLTRPIDRWYYVNADLDAPMFLVESGEVSATTGIRISEGYGAKSTIVGKKIGNDPETGKDIRLEPNIYEVSAHGGGKLYNFLRARGAGKDGIHFLDQAIKYSKSMLIKGFGGKVELVGQCLTHTKDYEDLARLSIAAPMASSPEDSEKESIAKIEIGYPVKNLRRIYGSSEAQYDLEARTADFLHHLWEVLKGVEFVEIR